MDIMNATIVSEVVQMREIKGNEMVLMPRALRRKEKPVKSNVEWTEFLVRLAGFFLARAMPIEGIAPFGLAFLAMERRFSPKSLFSLLTVALGYASLGWGAVWRYIGAGLVYEVFLFFRENKKEPDRRLATVMAVMVAVFFDLTQMLWSGIGVGTILKTLSDGALVAFGVTVFDRCRGLMKGKKFFEQIPSTEEKLALCSMLGIGLLSFQGLPLPFSVSHLLGFVVLGLAGASGGLLTGTVAGIGIGFLLGIREELLVCLGIFGCCGFVCGAVSRLGKTVVALSLGAVGILLLVYAMSGGGDAAQIYEVVLGAVAVAALPGKVFGAAGRFFDFDAERSESNSLCRQQTQNRLEDAASAFANLAETFARISDSQNRADVQEVAGMVEMVADRVCRSCTRAQECWEKNFNATYKTMFRFLEVMERKGVLEAEDIGAYVSGRCLRQEALLKEYNRLFEIYKINQVWKSKLCENRELVRQQFHGVAQTLRQIAEELNGVTGYDALAAEEIHCRLKNKGVPVQQVRVLQAGSGRRSVHLRMPPPPSGEHIHTAATVLKSVLGTSFHASSPELLDGEVRIQFYESPRLRVSAGFATGCKQGENGDSHTMHNLSGGKYLAVLSDGMGSGRRASRESGALVELLEHFMEAGFDKTVAVKLINSVLVMKSAEEAFATVDMCMIDLYSGEAEFIKNGAEPSYIKRPERTEVIRSASLPVGMIPRVEIERFAHRLQKGEMVVMLSDGMQLKQGKEGWLRHAVESAEEGIPAQELADRIMEKALALKGGIPDDDMTVMVLKIE